MLLHGHAPLKSIARTTGFADPTHFTKVFRQRLGFTPGALRAQLSSGSLRRQSPAGLR